MKIDLVPDRAAPTGGTPSPPATPGTTPAAQKPVAPATPAGPAATGTSTDDRSTAFRPVEGGTEMQSGERLLVEAYAAIWIILFALVLLSWRRQRAIDVRMVSLAAAIEKARNDAEMMATEARQAKGGP